MPSSVEPMRGSRAMDATRQEKLKRFIIEEARAAGFDLVAITRPDAIPLAAERLHEYLQLGRHASMDWMLETEDRRADPAHLWPDVRSIVVLAMNYGPETDPLAQIDKPGEGAISVYARNRDYHDIIKGKLKGIAGRFAARTSGEDVKVFVDTAPVMEKPLAEAAGLGWQGKHTNLVSRTHGSWLFLGTIFTTADLPPDERDDDHCGSCRACLDACPTRAFPQPYQLDARRCISYLTIEHKGPIEPEFRKAIGNRIYGCDDCLAVCPWNKFAEAARETKLQARDDLNSPSLAFLLTLDDGAFRQFFAGSPIKRIGRDRFMRNVLIACGNSGRPELCDQVRQQLLDPSPLVRGAAVWALGQLLDEASFEQLRLAHAAQENDAAVLTEWHNGANNQ
ncbi:tRNA epoxyqueuosine(34) reductase QueG [Phyllobacterium sp. 0TCS1.6C]|uniref:tRNA epoxyqueuosine(34) reductase QueG n=1 Tax=unclassified Phyllobacterium TaxID=2638441 RepID=UPI002263C12A|nr:MULTISPECIES: tRNA epoxyqueuosine(34) reductase QueG [unclassified Phyllobacterium]MCX8278785.1 tRNA epoxyqueuosine(34) reductase QueG [Phyllobacterium sp. 0TCS1.6C]MCX8293385.1 tRNA epoxyqueuosine(34) reductase QueG [Phyllobacterium sp. 0TCS1.6A]